MFGRQAYRKLAKEFHPDKNPDAGDKVCIIIGLKGSLMTNCFIFVMVTNVTSV